MTDKLKIEILAAEYHRNGISGVGFAHIRLTFLDDRTNKRIPARAIVFDNGQEDEAKCDGRCAITTDDFRDNWRGDHFEPFLRKWLQSGEATEMMWGRPLATKPTKSAAEATP